MTAHHNPKRERFCQEYLIDLNGAQAAIRAGYAEKNAARQAYQMLTGDKKVQARVSELQAERAKRTEIDQDSVLTEMAKIAFGGLGKYVNVTTAGDPFVDLSQCSEDDLNLLSEITIEDYVDGRGEDARDVRKTKIKTIDKLSALDKLARHLGLYEKDNRVGVEDPLAELLREISSSHQSRLPTHNGNKEAT